MCKANQELKNNILDKMCAKHGILFYNLFKQGAITKDECAAKICAYPSLSFFVAPFFNFSDLHFDDHNFISVSNHRDLLARNGWERYRELLEFGYLKDSIGYILKFDIDDKLKEAINKGLSPEALIDHSPFECGKTHKLTLLDFCACYGSSKCFNVLLEKGADITEKTVYYSLIGQSKEIIKKCEDTGSDFSLAPFAALITLQNEYIEKYEINIIPFSAIIRSNNYNEIFKSLQKDRSALNDNTYLSYNKLQSAILIGSLTIAKQVTDEKELNYMTTDGETALFIPCKNGQTYIADFLISRGANIKTKNKDGLRAIHIAAKFGHYKIIQLLLNSGESPNSLDSNKKPPIYYAVQRYKSKVVQTLVEAGCNLWIDAFDKSILHFACDDSFSSIDDVKFLISKGARINVTGKDRMTPLLICAQRKREEILLYLLSEGADATVSNKEGFTAAHYAASHGILNSLISLSEKNCPMDTKNTRGETPLFLAANYGHLQSVVFLLSKEADPNSSSTTGKTVLMASITSGEYPIFKLLVESGSRLDTKTETGMTPLHLAVHQRNPCRRIVEYLLKHGADKKALNGMGLTPLDLAAKPEIIELLYEK